MKTVRFSDGSKLALTTGAVMLMSLMTATAAAQDAPLTNGPAAAAIVNPAPLGTFVEEKPDQAVTPQQPAPDETIVVRGVKERRSSWKRAETDHAVIYSNGSESGLRAIAADLEKLDYLLSVVFGREKQVDDTARLRITLIGNADFMNTLGLVNRRSGEGPYTGPIREQRYYDPRITGAMMATSRADLTFALSSAFSGLDEEAGLDALGEDAFDDDPQSPALASIAGIENPEITRPWQQALFAGYAQHYVTTHMPTAYPRWYIDGIGALFSTLATSRDGEIEFGRAPPGAQLMLSEAGPMNVVRILTTGTAADKDQWSVYHAWLLAHFFFVAPDKPHRKQQLTEYIGAISRGLSPADAAKSFGDLSVLQKEINAYGRGNTRFGRIPFPAERKTQADVVALTVSDAALLKLALVMDDRLHLPPAPYPGLTPAQAARVQKVRDAAVNRQQAWIADLRATVADMAWNADALVLLAEAECRIGGYAACAAAADRVLAQAPGEGRAAGWKAIAQINLALAGPAATQQAAISTARSSAVAANRRDPNALTPLLAYFRSFTDAGQLPTDGAMRGILKVIQTVPNAPEPRLMLAAQLARDGRMIGARSILHPVINGPWDSPERERALAIVPR